MSSVLSQLQHLEDDCAEQRLVDDPFDEEEEEPVITKNVEIIIKEFTDKELVRLLNEVTTLNRSIHLSN